MFSIFQLKEFRANYNFVAGTKTLDQNIERTELNILWMKQHFVPLKKWLKERRET